MTDRPIKRALLSVFDKSGLIELGEALRGHGCELISTGGTAAALRTAGLEVTDVESLTSFPEMLDGRVKTLHPAIHGGLLARRDAPTHMATLAEHGLAGIDLLVVNLYPFEQTVAAGKSFAETVEMIDIGGPAMVRSAAKNHDGVAVVTDPADYHTIVDAVGTAGTLGLELRRSLARKAFARTAAYDAAIAAWLSAQADDVFPQTMSLTAERRQVLRYGENPHQRAAFYVTSDERPGVATAVQRHGKALSYNNLADTDAAFELVAEFDAPACAIIKHANPCGVAHGTSLAQAYDLAHKADPISAFGGIVALNRKVDRLTAERILPVFTEVVIAPGFDEDAYFILRERENLRLLETGAMPSRDGDGLVWRSVSGGLLVQDRDAAHAQRHALQVVTKREPTPEELDELLFAEAVCKHVKSNAVVFVRRGMTVGIGAGQMSRVDAVQIAVNKAKAMAADAGESEPRALASVVASDAFFPFADGLLAAAQASASACIQPGGSKRDAEVIAAADDAGMAMVFTGTRHFNH
ncbi:MAG: bifunctional phosphoribosylaminoimidazolecarboxamide formyltransferase/IMP cyclohydrolase [Geminicoccaceae bacterium]